MKILIIVAAIFCTIQTASAQINPLRYDDNYDYLRNDTIQKKGIEKLKNIKLGDHSYLSFGGELREQLQYYGQQNFGDVPPSYSSVSTAQLWQRLMFHSNVEIGSNLRFLRK